MYYVVDAGKPGSLADYSMNSPLSSFPLAQGDGISRADNSITCNLCNENFTDVSSLRLHTDTSHRIFPQPCYKCGKMYKTPTGLKLHVRAHSNSFSYNCPRCEMGTNYRGDFVSHMARHLNQRPYACANCPRTFVFSSDLAKHRRKCPAVANITNSSSNPDSGPTRHSF